MTEPQYVYIKERQLRCHFCGNDRFTMKKTKLNQRNFIALDLEYFAKSTASYICTNCGHVHEFVKR